MSNTRIKRRKRPAGRSVSVENGRVKSGFRDKNALAIVQMEDHPIANRIKDSGIYLFPTIRIGHGSTGTVFEGYFCHPKIKVAIKAIDAQYALVDESEIEIWKGMDEIENIVRLKGFVEWIERDTICYYIAMELADYTLSHAVKNLTASRSQIIKYISDISKGLKYLFSKNIVHRDMKPENILIFVKQERAKLSDFGYRKNISAFTVSTPAFRYTPLDWAAPEVIHAVENDTEFPSNPSLDIFSLGLVTYYALNKVHPFGRFEIPGRICHGQFKESLTGIEYNENRLIWKMLQTNPKYRPSLDIILGHPLFWDKSKQLKFILDVVNHYKPLPLKQLQVFSPLFETRARLFELQAKVNEVFAHLHPECNWLDALSPNIAFFMKYLSKSQDDKNVFVLLSFITNAYNHSNELDSNHLTDSWFGTNKKFDEEKFAEYFITKFPNLVMFLHEILRDYDNIFRRPEAFCNEYYVE